MLIASLPPSPTQPAPLPRLRRAGFTLMELLVVIGIVALLATIVTVGIATALGKTVDRATTTRLEMLDTMLAAYATADNDSTGGQGNTAAKRLPPQLAAIPGGVTYSTRDSQPQGAAGDPLLAPSSSAPSAVLTEPAFARTQAVLRRLLTVSENQSAFATLPDKAKSGQLSTAGSLLSPSGAGTSALDPPLLLDGHGNAILYVPPTGLSGLSFKDGTRNVRIRATHGRAFWASAGADGLFALPGPDGTVGTNDDVAAADDNVYSTEVIVEAVP